LCSNGGRLFFVISIFHKYQYSASVSQDVKHGKTALHIAASAGHVTIVQLFLDLDKKTTTHHIGGDSKEETIAMDHPPNDAQEQPQARRRRHLVMIADNNGKTALHVAIARRQVGVVNVLLQYMQHYCSPVERHEILHGKTLDTGSTPLIVAAHWGLNTIIVQLLHQMNNNGDNGGSTTSTTIQILQEMDHSCSTPLIAAVRAGHESTVQLLLDYGSPVNVSTTSRTNEKQSVDASTTTSRGVSRRERSALHCAVELGMESMVQLLLNHGANVMATTSLGVTPLYESIQLGYDSIVGLLLQHLSHLPSPSTRTPPTLTTSEEDNVQHYQDHQHLFVLQDRFGTPALQEAIKQGQGRSMGMASHRIALQQEQQQQQQQQHLFQSVDGVFNSHSPCWSVVNYPAVVQRLLDHGVDPNVQDLQTGQTSLHIAANSMYDVQNDNSSESQVWDRSHEEIIQPPPRPPSILLQLLLDHPLTRCNVTIRDYNGRTPLHIALSTSHHRAIHILMEHGAQE
jgi:ankyrin repeat protein